MGLGEGHFCCSRDHTRDHAMMHGLVVKIMLGTASVTKQECILVQAPVRVSSYSFIFEAIKVFRLSGLGFRGKVSLPSHTVMHRATMPVKTR